MASAEQGQLMSIRALAEVPLNTMDVAMRFLEKRGEHELVAKLRSLREQWAQTARASEGKPG